MRLGGPIFAKYDSPKAWVDAVRAKGYRAASCPVSPAIPDAEIQEYRQAAADADIVIADRLTLHLDEVRPGAGGLDYATYLRELDKLDPDTPIMLEQLPNEEEYDLTAAHIRQIAQEIGGSV